MTRDEVRRLVEVDAIFPILEYPRDEKLLRRVAREVREEEFGTPEIHAYAQKLGDTMMANGGLGLAATQVEAGPADGAWAMFAMRVGASDAFGVVCNPVVGESLDMRVGREACLSFASVEELLPAPEQVVVTGRAPGGEPLQLVLSMVQARCAWHETRHLRGTLMCDAMSPLKRGLFLKAVRKARGQR